MTYKQKALALVDKLGADLRHGGTGTDFEITVDAPDGFHWRGDGVHQLVHGIWDAEKPEALWRDAFERMSAGLEKCDYRERDCADTAGLDHPDFASEVAA